MVDRLLRQGVQQRMKFEACPTLQEEGVAVAVVAAAVAREMLDTAAAAAVPAEWVRAVGHLAPLAVVAAVGCGDWKHSADRREDCCGQ